jgi:hypothetical protein
MCAIELGLGVLLSGDRVERVVRAWLSMVYEGDRESVLKYQNRPVDMTPTLDALILMIFGFHCTG